MAPTLQLLLLHPLHASLEHPKPMKTALRSRLLLDPERRRSHPPTRTLLKLLPRRSKSRLKRAKMMLLFLKPMPTASLWTMSRLKTPKYVTNLE